MAYEDIENFGLPALEEILSLLQSIRHHIEVTGNLVLGMGFKFDMGYTFARVIPSSEFAILENLEKRGILNLKVEPPSTITTVSIKNKEKFYDFYTTVADQINKLKPKTEAEEKKTKKDNKKSEQVILHLNNDGELWREPKKNHCYSMGKKRKRYKIIKYFLENGVREFHDTNIMANHLKSTADNLRKEIGKFSGNVEGKLDLKEKFIKGDKNKGGYRLNPKYSVISEK